MLSDASLTREIELLTKKTRRVSAHRAKTAFFPLEVAF